MATKLTKPVTRAVVTLTGTPLIVTLTEHGVMIREPRQRTTTAPMLPYGVVWMQAVARKVAGSVKGTKRRAKISRGKL